MLRGAPKTRLQGAPSSQHGSPRRLLSTRRRLSALDSQLFHSRPRLALGSRNSRSGYRLCGQRGLEFDCGLRKGLFDGRNDTTTRFIVCYPPASSFMILRSGTRDPNQSPSSTRAPSPGHPPRSCQPPSPTGWLAPGRNSGQMMDCGSCRWKICIHTKMFHRSFSPRSNCK